MGGTDIGRSIIWAQPATSSFTENYFAPTTARTGTGILWINGTDDLIECNHFSLANANSITYVGTFDAGVNITNIASKNTFVGPGGIIDGLNIIRNTETGNPGTPANSSNPINGCNTPLPVTFADVTATIKDDALLVQWTTLLELHSSYFDIEGSADGVHFVKLGTVSSKAEKGISDKTLSYSFTANISNSMSILGISLFAAGLLLLLFNRKNRWAYMLIVTTGMFIGMQSCTKNDSSVNSSGKNLFIRIAQVDVDGTVKYSKTIQAVKE